MVILVTGATGLVGAALTRGLLAESPDNRVRVGLRSNTPQPLPDGARAVVVGDVDAHTRWEAALENIHTVYHCAARVHHTKEKGSAAALLEAYCRVNVDGTLQLARQAALQGVRRMVFISSVKVHGETTQPNRPWKAHDALCPTDAYGISKMQAEQGLRAIAQQTGMEVTIVRPPLVYGPGVKANFARLWGAVRRGVPLPLGAVQDNRRSLVGLDNLVDLLRVCRTHPLAANQTFLVSDGEDVSTADLVRRMGLALGRPARLWPVPVSWLNLAARWVGQEALSQRVLGSLQLDIAATRQRLGWTPPLTLDQGLRQLVRAGAAS